MFIERSATATVERLAAGFPVVWLTGPRQSGKTTLSRHVRPDLPYVSLEQPDERDFAATDPRGFLGQFPDGAILDEVQAVPELMSWLQGIVDRDGRMGHFILAGSQQPAIAQTISQSLAGRVGRIELLPLSGAELLDAQLLSESLDEVLLTGGYPALFDRDVSPADWLGNYAATYAERDVRQLAAVRDLETFSRFLRMCAARSGQILNMSALGDDVGVSSVTIKSWLSILRATYIVDLVEPYYANVSTRLAKQPKLVFLDVGLMAYLLGIRSVDHVASNPLRGALFETWAITEVIKWWRNHGDDKRATFLRDKRGGEIDLAFEESGLFRSIQFKSGKTIGSDWVKGFDAWQSRLSSIEWADPDIVYGGEESMVRSRVRVRAWRDFARDPLG
ncbi:MAG TPA: ATP-binding protein [Candidatus Nanopelagicales bacterium]|nr:ATP-binding protein [Candidatus Nanopelagicales bacterium]